MHVKKGDTVVVITGKDKGKKGTVALVLPKQNRIVVEGVNVVKRSLKPRSATSKGQVIEKSLPIHVSNVKLSEGKKKTAKKTK